MADESRELTARFSADTSGFSSAVMEMKAKLLELNTSLGTNKESIKEVNDRLKALRQEQNQLAHVMSQTGGMTAANRQRYRELDTEIAQATADLGAMRAAQRSLRQEISETNRAIGDGITHVRTYSNTLENIKSTGSNLRNTVRDVADAYKDLAEKIYDFAVAAGKSADDINTLSKVNGMSTEEIQKYEYAAYKIDVSINTLTTTMARNIKAMNEYKDGNQGIIDTYDALGVAVLNADGTLRDSGDVYNDLIRALAKVENATERDTIALDLLGRSAQQINPLIMGGVDALEELGTQAEKSGLILSQESLDALNSLKDKYDNMQSKIKSLSMIAGETLVNSFDGLFDKFDEFSAKIVEMKNDGTLQKYADEVGESINRVVGFVSTAIKVGLAAKDVIISGVVALAAFKTTLAIGNVVNAAVQAIKAFKATTESATASQAAFNAVGASNPYVFVVAAIASVVAILGTFISLNISSAKSVDDLRQSAHDLSSELKNVNNNIKTLDEVVDKYTELQDSTLSAAEKTEELNGIQSTLNDTYGTTAEGIDLVNGRYDEQLEKLKALSQEQKELAYSTAQAAYNDMIAAQKSERENVDTTYTTEGWGAGVLSLVIPRTLDNTELQEAIKEAASKSPHIELSSIAGQFGANITGDDEGKYNAYKTIVEQMQEAGLAKSDDDKVSAYYSAMVASMTEYKAKVTENEQVTADLAAAEAALKDETQGAADSTDDLSTAIQKLNERTLEFCDGAIDSITAVKSALSKLQEGQGLTYKEVQKLIEIKPELANLFTVTEKGCFIEQSALEDLSGELATSAETRIESEIEMTQAALDGAKERMRIARVEAEMYSKMGNVEMANNARDAIADAEKEISEYQAALKTRLIGIEYALNFDEASKTRAKQIEEEANLELAAKKKVRDYTIKAIDDEIQKRKELREDKDLQEQIDALNAQLKYSQLDEFSRASVTKKRDELLENQADTEWNRQATAAKEAAKDWYDTAEDASKATEISIDLSKTYVDSMMAAVEKGLSGIAQNINNISNITNSPTANYNVSGTAFTSSQWAQIIRDALADDINP